MSKVYLKNNKMNADMEKVFKLSTMIQALKEMPVEDMEHYRNNIIMTILLHTSKGKGTAEILQTIEIYKKEVYKIALGKVVFK